MAHPREIIARNLLAHFARSGLTQKQLAERTGLTQPAVSSYLTGKMTPGPAKLMAFATALGVSVQEIVGEAGAEQVSATLSRIAQAEDEEIIEAAIAANRARIRKIREQAAQIERQQREIDELRAELAKAPARDLKVYRNEPDGSAQIEIRPDHYARKSNGLEIVEPSAPSPLRADLFDLLAKLEEKHLQAALSLLNGLRKGAIPAGKPVKKPNHTR